MKIKYKKIALIALLLFCIPIALACKPEYGLMENVVIEDAIVTSGAGAVCNTSVYSNNSLVASQVMTVNGLAYKANFSILEAGVYVANIECNNGFTGECNFEVKQEETMSLTIILGFIFIIAILILTGAANIKMHRLNSSKLSFYMTFVCFGLAVIEFIMVPYIMAVMYENGNIFGLLQLNFIVLFIITFSILFFTLFRFTLHLLRFDEDEVSHLKKW